VFGTVMAATIAVCRRNVASYVVGLSHLVPSRLVTFERHCGSAGGRTAAALPLMEVRMQGDGNEPAVSRGEQIQAAEREAAKQRILALAEAERIPVEETTRAIPDQRWRRGQ
jgi:hypothetical protein